MPLVWKPRTLSRLTDHPGRFYSYAPCAVRVGDKTRVYWCQNAQSGVIRDHIYYAETTGKDAPLVPQIVLPPNPVAGAWDSFHVCDPSVALGRFTLGKKAFQLALFYLGNDVNASRHNQIGVALANEWAGPWERLPLGTPPLIAHDDASAWGVGQPSAIAYMEKRNDGRVWLFYTIGDKAGTRMVCRTVDLSEAERPVLGEMVTLPTSGLSGTDNKADWFNNADFAYHAAQNRFYVVREMHPYPATAPRFIGSGLQIASIPAEAVQTGRGTWRVENEITPELTGFARSHNAGFVRTGAGYLPRSDALTVVFSSSLSVPDAPVAEWTYQLWSLDGRLSPGV